VRGVANDLLETDHIRVGQLPQHANLPGEGGREEERDAVKRLGGKGKEREGRGGGEEKMPPGRGGVEIACAKCADPEE
jgi:hypothetical protein